jgi:hypothetical protein
MPRRPNTNAFSQQLTSVYTSSAEAQAIAAHAEATGVGEVRVAATSPFLAYVVRAPKGPAVEALASYASTVWAMLVHVHALETFPEPQRTRIWNEAERVAAGPGPGGPASAGA